ncbi:beta-N-acetylhexosaminidase [Mucilaginibacter sp. X4EP1]|uniref:beta-N-acetylhexosaminidase n=1 Tax=Mucilaginibacter sp. X4EP1 TaxID=2723092 RepID=UPI002169AAE4|nr:beta-N-acetylhexosaminidase [Mucilaginibacter sp. X4EP1]MCS3812544.1 hexosaminidase [Mucilaginibacter sp. X4EP1]
MLVCYPHLLSAQSVNIIPLPNLFKLTEGTFHLNGNTIIGMNSDMLLPQAHYLQTELQKADSLLVAVDPNEVKALIDLQLVSGDGIPGAYSLKIEPQHVTIKATDNQGIFYGIVSLLQLIKQQPAGNDLVLQSCEIIDAPRYQWRGLMLDESRHFFGKEKVKQLLDWMAFYKLNKLHWHLTDGAGWRIEIKKYPQLTAVGGCGNHTDSLADAQYYTQDDIKEIVVYASERFITIVPEIDMPGHATAANRAYPEFSGGITPKYPNFTFDPANENVYAFLANVLKEVDGLFPGNLIHLGGDEVSYGIQAWAGRPAITEMLTKNNFTSLNDLEHYFFKRMADTVFKLNDKVLCWDEAADTDLPAGKTIVFWWRQNIPGSLQLALQKKYQVVLCPRLPLYFDFMQDKEHLSGRKWNGSFNSESEVYNFPDKQMPPEIVKSSQILGIQANLWTETVGSAKRLDFMIFPRIAALAEAAWTDSLSKNETSFNDRLKTNFILYDKAGIYYYNPFNPPAHPEAIDFAPHIVMPHLKERRGKHGHKRGGHHHSPGSISKEHHHAKGKRKRRE